MLNPVNVVRFGRERKRSFSELQKLSESERDKDFDQKVRRILKEELETLGLSASISRLNERLGEVDERMDRMQGKSPRESAKKDRVKDMVLLLLKKHGKLTAFQLSSLLNLSRTRCSEYLKEMEKEGLLQGNINCRKRFYELRQ